MDIVAIVEDRAMEMADAATLMTCARTVSIVKSTQLTLSSITAGVIATDLVLTMIFLLTFLSDYVFLDVNKGVIVKFLELKVRCARVVWRWTCP